MIQITIIFKTIQPKSNIEKNKQCIHYLYSESTNAMLELHG